MRGFDGLNGQPGLAGRDFFFDSPFTAAADGKNLILTSWFGNTVEVWSPVDQEILEVHLFEAPPLNAIRFQSDLVVAELGTGKVIKIDSDTGERLAIATGLDIPTGLAKTEDDLWVADWATGKVWQIVRDGSVLETPALTAEGLVLPEGLAVYPDGGLLVVESGLGRLSRIDPGTGEVTTVADNLGLGAAGPAGWPPTWLFNGVAVGETGAIYVTGDIDNAVYRIDIRP